MSRNKPLHLRPGLAASMLLLLAAWACGTPGDSESNKAETVSAVAGDACAASVDCAAGFGCTDGQCVQILPLFARAHVEEALTAGVPLTLVMDYLAEVNHQMISAAGVCYGFEVTGWDPAETDPSRSGHPQPDLQVGFDLRIQESVVWFGIVHWEYILGLTEYKACKDGEGSAACQACRNDPDAPEACLGGTSRVRATDFLVGGGNDHGPAAKFNAASTMAHELAHTLLRNGVWYQAGLAAGANIGLTEHRNPANLSLGSYGYRLDPWERAIARQTAAAYTDASLPCYPMPGDLDFNGRLEQTDVGILEAAIAWGSDDLRYDLDRDGPKETHRALLHDHEGPPLRAGQGFRADIDADDVARLQAIVARQ